TESIIEVRTYSEKLQFEPSLRHDVNGYYAGRDRLLLVVMAELLSQFGGEISSIYAGDYRRDDLNHDMTRYETKPPPPLGMPLIEILVVLVLIGIVLGIVGGNFIGKGEKAKADAARIEIGQIAQTLDLYKLEVGRYPTTQEGLQALITSPAGVTNWNGPYWKRNTVPKDPWGNEYKYTSPAANGAPYEIGSYAADGKEGGEGPNKDISSNDIAR